jgi:AcrR family transcriptional regulator
MVSEEKQKILDESTKIFLQEGFYKTPMDEIARELKISKKTIYKYFDSKDTLVKEVVLNFLEQNKNNILNLLNENNDAVTKCFNLFQYFGKLLVSINDKWIRDIQEHYRYLWKEIDEFRTKMMLANISILIEQGKAEGFIVDYPTNIIVTFFISSVRGIINPDFIVEQKLEPKTILNPTINLLMNAILTDKGKEFFNELQPGVSK